MKPVEPRTTSASFVLLLLLLLLIGGTTAVGAPLHSGPVVELELAPEHDLGESYMFLFVHSKSINVGLEVATKDLNAHLGFGFDEEELWSETDFDANLDSILAYLDPRWEYSIDGNPIGFTLDSVGVRYAEKIQFVLLYYSAPIDERPDEITMDYQVLLDYDPRHRGLLVISQDFEKGTVGVGHVASMFFGKDSSRQELDLTGGSWFRGFWTFVVSGAWHIWIGIDHILFLLALLFPAVLRREGGEWVGVEAFRPALINVVKIVTVFTVAHSITLVAAALGVIRLPSHIVEAVIAFSIAIAAFDILKPVLHKKILIVVFVFGLFHGFGFANVLGHAGLEGNQLLLALFGFNVGVELGQLSIVCAAFPILFLVRKTKLYRKVFLPVAAVFLIIVSFIWVAERLFGYDIRIRQTIMGWLGR